MSFRVTVHAYPSSEGHSKRSEAVQLDIPCGTGEQLVRWLGHATCLKLAYAKRDSLHRYLPHAVMGKDGSILDADHVMKEVIKDGDDIYVEYGNGPQALTARWEGRPDTPDFQWGQDGIVLPSHDLWLQQLDLQEANLHTLVDQALLEQDPDAVAHNLDAVKALLIQYAGSLQACFFAYECQGDKDPHLINRMSLTQFKSMCSAANIPSPKFTVDRIEEPVKAALATAPAESAGTMTFRDFLMALVHVAHCRFAAHKPDLSEHSHLADKLDELLSDCVVRHIFPELTARLERLQTAQSKGASLMLRKGRRLVEQTLDSCQMKRIKAATVQVEVKHLACHMANWNMLGQDFLLKDLVAATLMAKHRAIEVEVFQLKQQPITLNYDEFEAVILYLAYHMYTAKKRNEPFEEYLGEFMDRVFRTSGVLVDFPQQD